MKYPTDGAEFWMPFIPLKPELVRSFHANRAIGRLKDNVTEPQALADLETIATRLATQYPDSNTAWSVELSPLFEQVVGKTRPALLMLSGAVAFVRVDRVRETDESVSRPRIEPRRRDVLRTALGAPRSRLAAQCLTEVGLLTAIGAGAGLLLATWSVPVLVRLSPGLIPPRRRHSARLSRGDIHASHHCHCHRSLGFDALPSGERHLDLRFAEADESNRARASQPTAGNLRRLANCRRYDSADWRRPSTEKLCQGHGFDPDSNLAGFWWVRLGYLKLGIRRTKNSCNCTRAFSSASAPCREWKSRPPDFARQRSGWRLANFRIQGKPVPRGSEPLADYRTTTVNYFKAMQIPLVTGRVFDEMDNERSSDVVLINETMAGSLASRIPQSESGFSLRPKPPDSGKSLA